jgi:hypothetical protein
MTKDLRVIYLGNADSGAPSGRFPCAWRSQG